MGIQMTAAPRSEMNEASGPLPLPPQFDRKAHAAKWVQQGPLVDAAREREPIVGTPMSADGWEIWRYPEGDNKGKHHVINLQKGPHILLHRSRAVQDAVNAITGNIGKERLLAERNGETVAGVPVDDPGLLSDARIAKVEGVLREEAGDVIMNKVPNVEYPRVSTPTVRLKSVSK